MHVDRLYNESRRFTWRTLCNMGALETHVEYALQGLLVVLFRRLRAFDAFEYHQPIGRWLFATAYRIAHECWCRSRQAQDSTLSSAELAEQAEALRTVFEVLDCLDDDRRAVFVLPRART